MTQITALCSGVLRSCKLSDISVNVFSSWLTSFSASERAVFNHAFHLSRGIRFLFVL